MHETHRLCDMHCGNAHAHGFSPYAGVRCDANDRQGIEQLCRYITRRAISHERLAINREGNVVLKLKTPWRNGTPPLALTLMELISGWRR